MNENKEVRFLPFHAINEFMLDEYRLEVITKVMTSLSGLPDRYNSTINRLSKKLVKVPGFRNSLRAPLQYKLKSLIAAFEKNPEFVATIISGWAELNHDLRERVFRLLNSRNWEILPLDTDRTKLPGFITVWPIGENFDVLSRAFNDANPDSSASNDDISLMTVWISVRLPC